MKYLIKQMKKINNKYNNYKIYKVKLIHIWTLKINKEDLNVLFVKINFLKLMIFYKITYKRITYKIMI